MQRAIRCLAIAVVLLLGLRPGLLAQCTASFTPFPSAPLCAGTALQASATGSAYTYQWQDSTSSATMITNISGATSSSFTPVTGGRSYRVVITNTSTSCVATSPFAYITLAPVPVVSVTPSGPTTFCAGGSVSLTGNCANCTISAPGSFQWYLNGTAISGATANTYTTNFAGNYSVCVTNSSGCTSCTSATSVTVNPLPNATITPSGPTTFCTGGTVTLCAPYAANQYYQWYQGALALAGGSSACYTAIFGGSYAVCVSNVVTGCSACSGATVTVGTTIPSPPTVTSPVSYCQGAAPVTLTAVGSNLQWYSGTTALPAAPVLNSSSTVGSQTYSVTQTVGGCTSTASSITANVYAPPVATTTPSGTVAVCSGYTVTLCPPSYSSCTYQWYSSGGPISGVAALCYTTGTAGIYYVRITNTTTGCSANSTPTTVVVNANPTVSLIASGSTTICAGDSVQLCGAVSCPTSTTCTYQILPVCTPCGPLVGYCKYIKAGGSYTGVMTSAAGCQSTSTPVVVTLMPVPAKPTASSNTPVCAGDSLHLLAVYSGTGSPTFSWTGPNSFASSLQNPAVPNINAGDSGVYRVQAVLGTCNSLKDSLTVQVTCLDSVWPGDVNYDLTADYLDALEIGLNLGNHGPARAASSIAWQAYHGRNWASSLTSNASVNGKHADCDGDSIVTQNDTLAVTLNYGLTHLKGIRTYAKTAGVPDLFFDLSGIVPMSGKRISVPIMLGSSGAPMLHISGIAAKIMVDGITPTDTPVLSFAGSWIGLQSATMRFAKGISNNRIDWVFVRSDHHNVSGGGLIGYVSFTLPQGSEGQALKMRFEDVVIVDSSGARSTAYNVVNDSTGIVPNAVGSTTFIAPELHVFPNPSSGKCVLELRTPFAGECLLELRDLSGKMVWSQVVNAKAGRQQMALPTETLSAGTYFVRCTSRLLPPAPPLKWVKLDW